MTVTACFLELGCDLGANHVPYFADTSYAAASRLR